MSYAWITIPHQGRPSIFGPFNDMAGTLDFVQQYESSENFNTQPMPEILKSAGVEAFLVDAGRQYYRAYVEYQDELINSVKNPRRYGHLCVEFITEARKFVFDYWYAEAREDFLDGFAETCGAETKADAEKAWDDWSNNIQGGPKSEGFSEELLGYSRGREQGIEAKEAFAKGVLV